jgi:hypothetical protein
VALSIAITLALVTGCAFVHYEVLSRCNALLPRAKLLHARIKVLVAVGAAMVSHVLQVALFASAYYFLKDNVAQGHLAGQPHDSFATYLYFSLETYTSLGFGDVYPLGSLRMIAGMEALTGLLMISWTASFTYLEMSRYWRDDGSGASGRSRKA